MTNNSPSNKQNEFAQAVGEAAATAAAVTQCVGDTAVKTGQMAVEATTQAMHNLLEKTTAETGQTLAAIADIPLLKWVSDKFGAGWLKVMLGKVDVSKATARVKELQAQYPSETPAEIAHRLMVKKSVRGAGVGLATNIIPPIAAALLAVDLAATTQLQAELVYEIAAVYGLDLEDPARRGEVLAIFGLSLGSSGVVKTGLSFAEIIPGIGAMLGASTNAVMLYGLGFAACRYYEAKNKSATEKIDLAAIEAASEDYWQTAVAQRVIMDQILVHMVLASYPNESWSNIKAELQAATMTPEAIEAVASHLEKPEPLDSLIEQLDPNLALPLLARCNSIAHSNGELNEQESRIINALAQKASATK